MAEKGTAATTSRPKVEAVSNVLKKAVDWKIFELQSMLVSEEVDDEILTESIKWLQPRHYSEVVEERVTDGRCGYPLCVHQLTTAQTAAYRIDYAQKKIFSVETSKNYCSVACIEKAQVLERKYDSSLPYSRTVAKRLDLSVGQPSNIDSILDMLGPSPAKPSTPKKEEDRGADPPPPYHSDILDGTGAMEVEFRQGLPVPPAQPASTQPAPATATSTATELPRSPKRSIPRVDQAMVEEEDAEELGYDNGDGGNEDGGEKGDGGDNKANKVELSPTKREVFLPGSVGGDTAEAADSTGRSQPTATPRPTRTTASTTTSTNRAATTSAGAGPTMAEMFAQMNALRVKHNLDNLHSSPNSSARAAAGGQSTSGSADKPVGGNKFTNKSLLQETANSTAVTSNDTVTTNSSSSTTLRTGTVGRRPGPRSVRWGDTSNLPPPAAQATQGPATSTTTNTTSTTSTNNNANSAETGADKGPSPHRPILRANTVIEQSARSPQRPPVEKGKGSSLQGLRHGLVVERPNPSVVPESAILRKREVDVDDVVSPSSSAPAQKSARGAASAAETELVEKAGRLYISGGPSAGAAAGGGKTVNNGSDDEGEHWVDVDPAELLQQPADPATAMSIEGYVANVKKLIRVSPANTIRNLSHSPYATSATNGMDGGVQQDGPMVESQEDEREEQDMDSDGDGDGDDDGGYDDMGTWGSDEEGAEDGEFSLPSAEAEGRSMFLSLWSTLDELFAGCTSSVFDSSSSTTARGTTAATSSPSTSDDQGSGDAVNRPPIALEQQSAQGAVMKLLQRGLQTAESELDLMQQHLRLTEERAMYQKIKRRLLSTAATTMHMRSNTGRGGTSAGAGLQSAQWTVVGLLVIDAIVVKAGLGPLGRESDDATSTTVAIAGQRKDVALAMWGEAVQGLARALIKNAERKSSSTSKGIGRLRDGDLEILRSYFNYM